MSECAHKITQGREGEKGSWCVECGIKVWEVHDRPCGECAHFKDLSRPFDPYFICKPMLMRVSRDMHVTFNVTKPASPGREGGGLCFEPTP